MTEAELLDRLAAEASEAGYHINPDRDFALQLAGGLLANEARYGYRACPCRLASGERPRDLDIICPCDYRDADLEQYRACYCALYVDEEIAGGRAEPAPVPERRPPGGSVTSPTPTGIEPRPGLPLPVWRCKVCGYLCAREHPPGTCPVCKASKDRFERFM